jgi:glucose/arabinose dehydrogenase
MPSPTTTRRRLLAASAALLAGCAAPRRPAIAQQEVIGSEKAAFRVGQVVGGLQHPWAVAFLPDGEMLVTERPGRLRRVVDGRLLPEPVAGLPRVYAAGQGGLLDVALDPDFARSGLVYLSYADNAPSGNTTRVARAKLGDDGLRELVVIFEGEPRARTTHHFGSRLAFGPDGMLYITMGERNERDRAQNLGDHGGKLLRIRPDGAVPPDNPFVDQPGARPEIWTFGHRNPQGLAFRPGTDQLWLNEHGPRGGDEVNLIRKGANYGWPVVTYGQEYVGGRIGEGTAKPGMEPPVWQWTPSIAPSGMAFYRGDAFPGWQGDILVGALAYRLLARLTMDGDRIVAEERMLEGALGRIRDVRVGPDAHVYLLTDESSGGLFRLEPAAA